MRQVEVPDPVRRKAFVEGPECVQWLDDLGDLISELESEWDISVGATMTGGTASVVAAATRADGSPAVVKLVMPCEHDGRDALIKEVRVLRLADGRGCVRAFAYDADRGAVLLERLGRQLHELGLTSRRQIEIMCGVLTELWAVPPGDVDLPTLDEKGQWLAQLSVETWEALGRPCSERVIDRAVEYAERRVAAFDGDRAVLTHGDAHPWNTLEAPGLDRPDAFRLVDADGLLAEPEYDLAIIMRELTDELIAGDALRLGQERARFLAEHTGLDEQRIWEWGYIERVSTGLLCLKERHDEWGREFLTVAEAWSLA